MQLWELGGRQLDWLPGAAEGLFAQAVAHGWDAASGGFYYTIEWSGRPRIRDRIWWPCCEGIGAAPFWRLIEGDPFYEEWYRRIWNFSAAPFHRSPQTAAGVRSSTIRSNPIAGYFVGKPDIYHALQACLIPLYPANASLTRGIAAAAKP